MLSGEIPFTLMNLTKLTFLGLSSNNFQGPIPSSIVHLYNLEVLDVYNNSLNGTMELCVFLNIKSLGMLDLSRNELSLLIDETCANASLPKLESLRVMDLSFNFLTGFDGQVPIPLPWTNLAILDLSSNQLEGSLPIPPSSTLRYNIPNNKLSGKISQRICNLTSIQVLDLSNNSLSGSLPQCLKKFGDSLLVLNLQKNKLEGSIPQTWAKGTRLRMINFSENKFQNRLPTSLANLMMLEAIDLVSTNSMILFPIDLEIFQI
ncbi:receptor-like protein 7 [Quercus suber]|uniref:Receptor-like protein 7 n=1 Tax=Quercus suber TaxID=58331 RepID=A0AAW0LIM1_QUESU